MGAQQQPERCTESHALTSSELQLRQWAQRQDMHQHQPERCTASPPLTSPPLTSAPLAPPPLTSAELQLQTACLQLQEIRNQDSLPLHPQPPPSHKQDPKIEKFRHALADHHVRDYQQVPDVAASSCLVPGMAAMNSTSEQVKAYLAQRLAVRQMQSASSALEVLASHSAAEAQSLHQSNSSRDWLS